MILTKLVQKDAKNVSLSNLAGVFRHRLPSNEKLTADHASSIQSAKSTVEKKKFDERFANYNFFLFRFFI